ncbi:hypothetical protein GCM10028805_02850 [Spirosoma harenae]
MISLDSSHYQKVKPKLLNENLYGIDSQQTWYTQYGKRIFDITVALFVTAFVLSWMVPVMGIIIWATSPGPGLFVQLRTGRNGRMFRCFKFRTMYYEKNPEFAQAKLGDSRVTQIGQFLRRTNLDEMPQFLNVLLGDMSVVGPRPHAIQHDSQFWHEIDNYPVRYSVRPGITGLAQVRGARGETETLIKMKHRVRYDLHYAKRRSLAMDIKLCWMTIKPMIRGNVNAW